MVHIQNIQAWGYNSLVNSTIMSNYKYEFDNNTSIQGNELSITINDDIANEYFIYCNETDICYIYCVSNHSCTYMNLQCDGVCDIYYPTS